MYVLRNVMRDVSRTCRVTFRLTFSVRTRSLTRRVTLGFDQFCAILPIRVVVNLPAPVHLVPKSRRDELRDERLTFRTTLWATRHVIKLDVVEEAVGALLPSMVHRHDPKEHCGVREPTHLLVAREPERETTVAQGLSLSTFDVDDDIGPTLSPMAVSN